MEKFSAFRDPGTGIQPFLKPVPPSGTDVLATILLPVGYVLGAARSMLLVALAVVYVLVQGVCLVFYPVAPLHRSVSHIFTAILSRTALFLTGLYWIPVEIVARKRSRSAPRKENWSPRAGDLIVSNWASWVELLWLAYRFDPVFVLPICETPASSPPSTPSTPLARARTPGRRTGTGSAALSNPGARAPSARVPITGFRRVGLLRMLAAAGHLPLVARPGSAEPESLEAIRSDARAPVVVFPECTTSNGRALLRFAEVFAGIRVPVMKFKVFVMCVRYDPPTAFAPSVSHSIVGAPFNPLGHAFALASSLAPLTMSVRLLSPAESPSSGSFLLSEFLTNGVYNDELGECCAALMSQIGRVKRVGMGWEDKAAFLNLYKGKK